MTKHSETQLNSQNKLLAMSGKALTSRCTLPEEPYDVQVHMEVCTQPQAMATLKLASQPLL